jgi:hypothetical protein
MSRDPTSVEPDIARAVSRSALRAAIANAFEKQKALPKEGPLVVVTDIAGARFVSRYHPARIIEPIRLAV